MSVTYGASRSAALRFTTPKDPSDVVVYSFDFTNELATGETLSTRTVTVASGLTNDADAISGNKVNVTLSGGVAGTDYTVLCQATTSTGRTLNVTGIVQVRQR